MQRKAGVTPLEEQSSSAFRASGDGGGQNQQMLCLTEVHTVPSS